MPRLRATENFSIDWEKTFFIRTEPFHVSIGCEPSTKTRFTCGALQVMGVFVDVHPVDQSETTVLNAKHLDALFGALDGTKTFEAISKKPIMTLEDYDNIDYVDHMAIANTNVRITYTDPQDIILFIERANVTSLTETEGMGLGIAKIIAGHPSELELANYRNLRFKTVGNLRESDVIFTKRAKGLMHIRSKKGVRWHVLPQLTVHNIDHLWVDPKPYPHAIMCQNVTRQTKLLAALAKEQEQLKQFQNY